MADVRIDRPSGQSSWLTNPRDLFSMNPFSLMRRMSEEMDRFFAGVSRRGAESQDIFWAPDIEVFEREGNMVVSADLPGLDKDDVKVEATEEGLVIQGERKRESEERKEGFYRSERSYGRFYRLIPLPEGASIDEAQAQFKNGVLTVSVPIPERQQKRRQIQIEEGSQRTAGGGA